ncbi:MAG: hypothetical protein OES57_07705, partial [Acidimicrobiia bacterium]|nr:hypothetical protein [Acidimicrobiia bacterium]
MASNASDSLFASDEELQHWQRVEAEAWGTHQPAAVTLPAAEETHETNGTSRPIAFFALLALVAIAGLWLYTRQASGDQDSAAPKAIVTPAVAREVPDPCSVLSELRAVQADAYVRLLGQTDPLQRAAIVGERSRTEVRLIDQLLEVEPALTMNVAPIRYRSQLLVDGMPDVDAGTMTIEQLLASTQDIDDQAADGDRAV